MNIYVGNLAYSVTDEELRTMFGPFGEVTSSNVIVDRMSGRSKGFGFIEMPQAEEAQAAIAELNEKELGGRKVIVNEARPKGEGGFRKDRGSRPPRNW